MAFLDRVPQGTGKCIDCNHDVHPIDLAGRDFIPLRCPTCAEAEANAAELQAFQRSARRQVVPIQNLPPALRRLSFESYTPNGNRRAFDVCRVYADSFPRTDGRGLALQGGVGIGKTHLAVSVARSVPGSYVINAVALLDELRRGFAPGASPTKVWDYVMQTPLLVLDDMGKQKPTEWVAERLYQLLNHRTEYLLPVIVTTNDDPSIWDSRWTPAVADRVRGMCALVSMSGLSHRRAEL